MNNAQPTTVHGVFISIWNAGTLIIGASGIGKSDLALSLIDRGHPLIADDAIEFSAADDNTLTGRAPKLLQNYLNIRGLGVVNIAALFGTSAILEKQTLSLVIKLEKPTSLPQQITLDSATWTLCDITVPFFHLPLSTTRPREVLLETLVRNHQLAQTGNHADMQFIANHHQALSTTL